MKYDDFAEAIGKPISRTNLLQLFSESVTEDKEIKPPGTNYYIFPETGIEIIVRGPEDVVRQIIMYGPHYSANYDVFRGELPLGTAFGENAHSIKAKLGEPDRQKFVDKPDVDELLFKQIRYEKQNHLLDFIFNEGDELFLCRLLHFPASN